MYRTPPRSTLTDTLVPYTTRFGAAQIDGYLGMEFARDEGCGITVSYWRDLDALRSWRDNIAHVAAQRQGRERFYLGYRARICHVEREYEWSRPTRSEAHTSELQSLMRLSYAVFCLKKKHKRN